MGSRTFNVTLSKYQNDTTYNKQSYYNSASFTTIPSDSPGVTEITATLTKYGETISQLVGLCRGTTAGYDYWSRCGVKNSPTYIDQTATMTSTSDAYFDGLRGYSSATLYSSSTNESYASGKNTEWKVIITFTDPKITWSGATLSLSRSGNSVTATKGGSATHNNGNTITYYLYEGSTNLGAFSGNTKTISNVSAATHTYKVMASGGTVSAQGGSASVTVPAAAITWSNATLTLTRSNTTVTATKGGTATHNYGTAVTYYLYEGSTKKGTFSGNTLTLSNVSAGTHTYKVVASAGGISKDGASKSIDVPAAAITWSNATLTLAQSDTTVTATKGGTATHNYGTAVTYYLYEGSTKIGTFSGNTLSFTPSVGAHTYKTVASGGGISKDGASASITVVSPHKTLKIYNSSGWVECIIYRYNGSSFIEVEPYYYNGTKWSECSHT